MSTRDVTADTEHSRRAPIWGLLPMLIVQIALFVVPLAIMFVYSFWTSRNYRIVPEWTLANYQTVFTHWIYLSVLFRTLWTSAIITVVTVLLAYPFAYWIVRYTSRWQKFLLGAVVLSFWTSGLLRAYAWMAILGNGGIINKGLMMLGIIDEPLTFLIYNPFSVVVVMTYFSLPFAVISMTSMRPPQQRHGQA